MHAVSTAADACIAVALAGSLFFNTSLDVARPRLALYLALTLAPVALMTPLIGPAVARYGAGSLLLGRIARARVACALMLALHASSLLLYPESLAVLVLGRAYAVVKRSLVPALVGDESELVAANARLSRVGSIAGLAGGIGGSVILRFGNQSGLLFTAALLHGLGACLASRVPVPAVIALDADGAVARARRIPAAATRPLLAMAALRLTTGFVLVLLALALERAGEPATTLALLALAVSVGSFAGTYVSPRLRERMDERVMLGLGAIVAAVAALTAAASRNLPTMIVAVLLLALASSVGRHSCDSVLQRETTHTTRNRAFAWYEAALQLAWAGGALIATVALLDVRSGFLAASLILVLGSIAVTRAPMFGLRRVTATFADPDYASPDYVSPDYVSPDYVSNAARSAVTSEPSPSAAA
jgi:hypothetical protein